MQDAFLVVGLGNPGVKYENTRHNAGFLAVECLCERWGVALKPETKFNALVGRGFCGERQVILCQPQTYMNASGKSVAKLVNYFKIKSRDLMVMVDDADLELGTIRLRARGSSGGHNGLKSIASVLGGDDYARLKIGIGRQVKGVLHQHVLGRFETGEMELLERVLDKVVSQVQLAISDGVEVAMNRFNGRVTIEERK